MNCESNTTRKPSASQYRHDNNRVTNTSFFKTNSWYRITRCCEACTIPAYTKNVYYVCTSKTLRRRIKNWKKNTNKNKHRYRFQAVQYSDWINVKKNRFELKHGFLRSAHTEQHSRATQPTNDTRTNSDNNLRVDNKKPGPQRCELMWSSRDRFASRRADRDVRWSVT